MDEKKNLLNLNFFCFVFYRDPSRMPSARARRPPRRRLAAAALAVLALAVQLGAAAAGDSNFPPRFGAAAGTLTSWPWRSSIDHSIDRSGGRRRRSLQTAVTSTWLVKTSADSNTNWNGVAWGPTAPNGAGGSGLFVAVGDRSSGGGTNNIQTSPDGSTWTGRVAPADRVWSCIAWCETKRTRDWGI